MIERITKLMPGWDDFYDECRHPIKGDHGIHNDDVIYIVGTETPDGRRVALSLEVGSNKFPATIPESHWRGDPPSLMPPARGRDLSLHVQPLAGMHGIEHCACLPAGVACVTGMTTALGAGTFYEAHGNLLSAFEQPETFWVAMEARLTQCLAEHDHFPKADELSVDTIVGMLDVRLGRMINVHRWIGGPPWEVTMGGSAIGQGDTLTAALRHAYQTVIVLGRHCL